MILIAVTVVATPVKVPSLATVAFVSSDEVNVTSCGAPDGSTPAVILTVSPTFTVLEALSTVTLVGSMVGAGVKPAYHLNSVWQKMNQYRSHHHHRNH